MVLAVRQLQTRGEWWEAAGCVEHTDRVQLHLHAKLVAIQTEARPEEQVAIQLSEAGNMIAVRMN